MGTNLACSSPLTRHKIIATSISDISEVDFRFSCINLHAGKADIQPFVGQWQALWQYLGCLLQCGDLYEAMGVFEDALHAFKEGLRLVSRQASAKFHHL